MLLDRQQAIFADWRREASGDIHVVERALILATKEAGGRPPAIDLVKQKIHELMVSGKDAVHA